MQLTKIKYLVFAIILSGCLGAKLSKPLSTISMPSKPLAGILFGDELESIYADDNLNDTLLHNLLLYALKIDLLAL